MSREQTSDGRRQRGDRTRQSVATRAAALASIDGLSGMTLSQVAGELGVSKSSIQAAFSTKEQLQLAAVEAASDTFVREVVVPAMTAKEGAQQLRALAESWLGYVERRVFPGGCFMVATLSEFDSRPGPVRDALGRARRGWLQLLEHNARLAQEAGDIPNDAGPDLVAFEVDAILSMANVQRNISDDSGALDDARRLIALRLSGEPSRGRTVRSASRGRGRKGGAR